jgi:hypothetical protein
MDALRRHAAGELAEILGKSLIEHDRAQRYLQIRAAADRALPLLPADERPELEEEEDDPRWELVRQLVEYKNAARNAPLTPDNSAGDATTV